MRKATIKNKYNLTMASIKKLTISDRTKLCEPMFWRNNVINAWCIIGSSGKYRDTCSEFFIGIYDEDSDVKRKLKVSCSCWGGMGTYKFNKFFNPKDIESEQDLEIQELLLKSVNTLIDEGILSINN